MKELLRQFKWLKALNSPFKRFRLKFYAGPIKVGVPIFYPRKWIKTKNNPGYYTAKYIKWFGFNWCGLGYKIKWSDTDYRFEWNPVFSFVFCRIQFCIMIIEDYYYWEAWLYYENNTDKTKSKTERIQQCISEFPLLYTKYSIGGKKLSINHYNDILKKKYLKYTKL